jgi:hypothetical protein
VTSSAIGSLAALAFAALMFSAPGRRVTRRRPLRPYDLAGTIGASSRTSGPSTFDDETADDFEVPAGPRWNVTGVEVQGANFNGLGPTNGDDADGRGDLPKQGSESGSATARS